MYDVLNFEQNISNLSLDILSNLLKIISKQIIKLGGKPTEIMKIDISLVDLEKQRWADGVICPWCINDGWGYWKNGLSKKDKAIQRYKCKKCMKTFDFMTGTFLSYSHLTMEQLTKLIQCIILKLTCKKTGEFCSLSELNSWKQRIKILKIFDKTMENELLNGTIWLDETYILQNYKGNWKTDNKPEKLQEKEDFFKNNTQKLRGLSRFQTCILTGIDEENNIFLELNGFGKMNQEKSIKKLLKYTKNITLIFSDAEVTYKCFSENKKANHIVVKSNDKENKKLQKIDSLHSRLKSFLQPFNGISNIYLKFYLKWFHFLEKIKQDNNENQTHKVWKILLPYTFHVFN